MISYLKGIIIDKNDSSIILDVNGIGFEVFVTYPTLLSLPQTYKEAELFTYMQVKEDAMSLFGFRTKQELRIFKLLINVNGIGPKAAISILSNISVDDLMLAVISDDAKRISKVPGIGGKTASKLILELKDKFSLEDALNDKNEISPLDSTSVVRTEVISTEVQNEAIAALTALGISASDAVRAVKKVEGGSDMTTDELLKLSLKLL